MPFFGLGSKNKKKEIHTIKEKPEITYYAKYMGGLKKFPKEEHSTVLIFPDRIEVNPFGLKLSYSSIIDIEKLDGQNKISVDRLVALGFLTGPGAIAGLFWKNKHVYTVIHYSDYGHDEIDAHHSLILDFEDNLKYAYPLIFERMARSRPFQTAGSDSSISNSDLIIKSDKPSLLLSVEIGSATITPGNQQKLVVNVLDEKSNEKVMNAKVSGEIVYPSCSHVLLEEDISDNDGRVSYSWNINNNSELGMYSVKLQSTASGYKPSNTTTTFEVRK